MGQATPLHSQAYARLWPDKQQISLKYAAKEDSTQKDRFASIDSNEGEVKPADEKIMATM